MESLGQTSEHTAQQSGMSLIRVMLCWDGRLIRKDLYLPMSDVDIPKSLHRCLITISHTWNICVCVVYQQIKETGVVLKCLSNPIVGDQRPIALTRRKQRKGPWVSDDGPSLVESETSGSYELNHWLTLFTEAFILAFLMLHHRTFLQCRKMWSDVLYHQIYNRK